MVCRDTRNRTGDASTPWMYITTILYPEVKESYHIIFDNRKVLDVVRRRARGKYTW